MGTEISYHQRQVGHEADESRAKRADEDEDEDEEEEEDCFKGNNNVWTKDSLS